MKIPAVTLPALLLTALAASISFTPMEDGTVDLILNAPRAALTTEVANSIYTDTIAASHRPRCRCPWLPHSGNRLLI